MCRISDLNPKIQYYARTSCRTLIYCFWIPEGDRSQSTDLKSDRIHSSKARDGSTSTESLSGSLGVHDRSQRLSNREVSGAWFLLRNRRALLCTKQPLESIQVYGHSLSAAVPVVQAAGESLGDNSTLPLQHTIFAFASPVVYNSRPFIQPNPAPAST